MKGIISTLTITLLVSVLSPAVAFVETDNTIPRPPAKTLAIFQDLVKATTCVKPIATVDEQLRAEKRFLTVIKKMSKKKKPSRKDMAECTAKLIWAFTWEFREAGGTKDAFFEKHKNTLAPLLLANSSAFITNQILFGQIPNLPKDLENDYLDNESRETRELWDYQFPSLYSKK